MQRTELVTRLTELVTAHELPHPVRVAVDGPAAAGKTTLADELAGAIRASGRPALRVSVDDFHHPERRRRRRGSLSPEGYLRDAFDHPALRRLVLDPLGPAGNGRYRPAVWDLESDSPVTGPVLTAPPNSVLLVDGVFLLADELRDSWDLVVFVEVTPAESLRRALARDVRLFGSADVVRERYARRYLPGQQMYHAEARPTVAAHVVIRNDDPNSPSIRKWPRGTGDGGAGADHGLRATPQ